MEGKCKIEINGLTEKNWSKFLAAADFVPLQQNYSYGQAVKIFNSEALRVAIYFEDELVGVCQIFKRKILKFFTLFLALRGPVWIKNLPEVAKAECYRELKKSLPRKFPNLLLFMPEEAQGLGALKRVVSSYSTVIVDLGQDEAAIMAGMDGKWRNRLKAAQKSGLVIKTVSPKPEKYNWLLEKEEGQAASKGYKALPPIMVPFFQASAGKEAVLVLRAEFEGAIVGGVLILIHNSSATYHIGWSNELGKKLGANSLLLWEAIRKLKAKNINGLDLGGVSTEGHSAGLARFKIGLCNNVVTLPGSYI